MAESKITVARVKDKVGGREAEVSKLLYSDNGNIKTIGGDSAITVVSAKTLNGETKEQLLSNVNAATVGGKSLAQIQSRGMFGPIRLLPDNLYANCYISMVVTENEELLFCGANNAAHTTFSAGNMPSWINIPHPLQGKSKVKQLVTKTYTTYLLYENGDLYGIGQNTANHLGNGNTANQFDWVKITDNVDKLFLGKPGYASEDGSASAVIKKDKSIWFWGTNAYGHAGMGNTTALTVPTKLALTFLDVGDSVKDLILNDSYYTSAYIITEKGKLYSCGGNTQGQLGINDKNNRSTFTQVTALQDKKVVSLTASMSYNSSNSQYMHAVVVASCSDNTHYVWGNSNSPITSFKNQIPTKVEDSMFPSGYKQVNDPIVRMEVCGIGSFYALTRSGRLFACGYSSVLGQLGVNATTDVVTFKEVVFADSTTSYKVKQFWGTYHSVQAQYGQIYAIVEIDNVRYLYAAGYNGYGQLGLNHTNAANSLTRVPFNTSDIDNIKQVYVQGYENINNPMILLNDGRVYICGYNANGTCGLNHVVTPITRFVQTL